MLLLEYGPHRRLHSFPTRRSSDLIADRIVLLPVRLPGLFRQNIQTVDVLVTDIVTVVKKIATSNIYFFAPLDRKSTRLNSSHVKISYAVFCLKKKIQKR